MKKLGFFIILFFGISSSCFTYAYFEDYSPYRFGKNDLNSLNLLPILGYGSDEAKVRVGEFEILKRKKPNSQDLFSETVEIKRGNKTLIQLDGDKEGFLTLEIYYFDFDGNKKDDFLIVRDPMGNGLGGASRNILIFLQDEKGNFRRLEYDTYLFEIKDFIDPDRDEKLALMILDISDFDSTDKKGHSFWVYTLYEFDNLNLKRVREEKWGLPKFIWYTNDPNDKVTEKITSIDKSTYLKGLPEIIRSR